MSSLTTVVIPVKDEDEHVLTKLVYDLQAYGWTVIVVDDGSKRPVKLATIRHAYSHGYGAAIKAGVQKATTDLIVTMDGDGQHTARDVKRLEEFICYFPENTMVIGDRRVHEPMFSRYWGRKALNWLASLFAGRWIADLNSGLRIFKRSVAVSYEPILSRGFSYTTTLSLSMMADGYSVDFLPIKVWPRQHGQTKVHQWRDGWITLKAIIWIGCALRTRGVRKVLRRLRGRPV